MKPELSPNFTEEALKAIDVISNKSGLPTVLLETLATSGQMRTSREIASHMNKKQSEITKALLWLEQWGLVLRVKHEHDDISENYWSITDDGYLVMKSFDKN